MKNSYLIKHIRILLLRRLILPTILLLLGIVVILTCSDFSRIRLLRLSQYDHFEEYSRELGARVRLEAGELCYTGCDYTVNGRTKGHYYYTLDGDGFCQFYILSAKKERQPEAILYRQTVKGHLYRMEDGEYSQLLSQMADDIGWTGSGIRAMSSPYAVSEIVRYEHLKLLALVLASVCAALSGFDILRSLICLLLPLRSPALRPLRKYKDMSLILHRIEMELKHTHVVRAGSTWLTSGFLINLDDHAAILLPLDSVARVYQHGHFRWLPGLSGRRLRISSSLYVTTKSGRTYEFPHKRKEELEAFLSVLERKWPEIVSGYHE